ncbi:MAG: 4Fe-4S binding protein [Deltaproteobacteria bacterium]|uniref:4Fe-4S binding protein n=1 Tax=Candidatus Zymogenus saltonus TaxID=2844893 RepID=A0A9D8KDZ6_9DELT|nr:4Fe-4S binding protein [Candidatus Zymogenus saltonus]
MTDVYKSLAVKLDELPQGFPKTETGVEIRILKKIFSPEDAEIALKLRPYPETVEEIAERLGKSPDEMRNTLFSMAEKGQIASYRSGGVRRFFFAPFVVGIYEFQIYKIDKELAELFEEYLPTLMKTLGGHKPAIARVVPVNTEIKGRSEIVPHDDIRRMIEDSSSFILNDCLCRKEQALAGNPCKHEIATCLGFSKDEDAYEDFTLGGKIITKEEALKVLSDAEEAGLVHNLFYNTIKGHIGVCNCCPCCCGVIRGVREFGAEHILARSNYLARIDDQTCTACGICADERCPVNAIDETDGIYRVIEEKCMGCGLCLVTCPVESITLEERPSSEREDPPRNMIEWSIQRAQNRGLELKLK